MMGRFPQLLLLMMAVRWGAGAVHTEEELKAYLEGDFENRASKICTMSGTANWRYNTDLTEENSKELVKVNVIAAAEEKEIYEEWFKDADLGKITDPLVKRQVRIQKDIGTTALSADEYKELQNIETRMTDTYSSAKICPFKKQECDLKTEGLSLEPDINNVLETSQNYDELAYVWKAWRDATGKKMTRDYEKYVEFSNKAAVLNGHKNNAEAWQMDYETPNFEQEMDKIWAQLRPFYNKLHSYARTKLIGVYGSDKIGKDGLIPAHLFGNMWAQNWAGISKIMKPYPTEVPINFTQILLDKGYTVIKMFEKADKFYQSLGLPSTSVSYGNDSMILRPKDREVVCHASAWDFCDRKTFRIKMCSEVNYQYFETIHHEMGHIMYYMLYKDQPITFRTGANPGFHEAIGDTIALSVANPKHFFRLGLLDKYEATEKSQLNTLMDKALDKISFLPFGLLVDKWRWQIFKGDLSSDKWNDLWWKYRKEYQKVSAPFKRSPQDFDAGSKYHVPADSQYIGYFIASVLEFQLYRSFCILAGEYDPNNKTKPLHNCDFYENKEVGDKFKAGLSLGYSKHWSEVLKTMTNETQLDPTAILEYFDPLIKYLDDHSTRPSAAGCNSPTIMLVGLGALSMYFTKYL